jgi:hypothetical protein
MKPDRVKRIRGLVKARASDSERWSSEIQLKTWGERSKRASHFIPRGSKVLDLGCGNMNLKDELVEGCEYIPADIVPRSEDCLVIELNENVWPNITADVVAALGVLEYIHDLRNFLERCSEIAPRLIFSYHVSYVRRPHVRRVRMELGWLNNFSFSKVVDEIGRVGGKIDRIDGFMHKEHFTQYLFVVTFATKGEEQ